MTDFGRDWSCTTDLDPQGKMVSGFLLLAQALVRRLVTPRGGLLFHPNYGEGILDMIGDVADNCAASRVAVKMDSGFLRDQRVQRSSTVATFDLKLGKVTATSQIMTAKGPFTLVSALSSATIEIIKAGS